MKQAKHLSVIALLFLFLATDLRAQEESLPFDSNVLPKELPETALVETTKGPFEIRFYREEAPITIKSFEYLARKGFYKGTTFHRYVPGFVIQGGDPLGTGKGGPGYTLPPEYSRLEHIRGTVGMARLPSEANPERRSNGSQFYICLSRGRHLDGLYTVFGEVISGMENVEKLRPGDKIIAVRLPRERVIGE